MEKDKEQKVTDRLFDMNGNILREGDLVMILLDKPVLTGYITSIESSLLSKKPLGCLTVTGTVRLPYDPTLPQILRQTAKLVDPRAAELIDMLTKKAQAGAADIELPQAPKGVASSGLPSIADLDKVSDEKRAAEKTNGPVLVPTDSKDVVDPRD